MKAPRVHKKVLLNASTIGRGGALQVTVTWIRHVLATEGDPLYYFAISPAIEDALRRAQLPVDSGRFFVIQASPARSSSGRRALLEIEARVAPHAVVTVFGPAYCRFRTPHLCGIADGWTTHADALAFASLPGVTERALTRLRSLYKAYHLRMADALWFETREARDGFCSRYRYPAEATYVIPNTAAPEFFNTEFQPKFPSDGALKVLVLSSYYSHKNIEVVPKVAALWRQLGLRPIEFSLTLGGRSSAEKKLLAELESAGLSQLVRNIGPVSSERLADVYRDHHLTFLPSFLETFTGVYPESFFARLPILTSSRRFAKDVCGDSAIYVDPSSPSEIVAKLESLSQSTTWHYYSEKSYARRKTVLTPADKWRLHDEMVASFLSKI